MHFTGPWCAATEKFCTATVRIAYQQVRGVCGSTTQRTLPPNAGDLRGPYLLQRVFCVLGFVVNQVVSEREALVAASGKHHLHIVCHLREVYRGCELRSLPACTTLRTPP
eukprot:6549444-Pyramimonas_sp.AAC.1